MKKLLLILLIPLLYSCKQPTDIISQENVVLNATLNSIKVDDDSEYHINYTYDNNLIRNKSDISQNCISIRVANIPIPKLTILSTKYTYRDGSTNLIESRQNCIIYTVTLPIKYHIEIFND